ncbi:MAG: inorganic diphosphatase, partial [Pseudomonadota bacterium]|nr:inorganic diphosphatase [Pseudomonadota bacterium]
RTAIHSTALTGTIIMAKKKNARGLANPASLPAFELESDEVTVIIETPKGSRNKYAFDEEARIFALKQVLPAGMTFPYDFGFVPSTLGGDGDPLDVLVLMDEPAFVGCRLQCRVIGVIEGEQIDKKEKVRNDRIIAIEQQNHSFASVEKIGDMGKIFCKELEEFFVNYHRMIGKEFKVLKVRGPSSARRLIEKAQDAAKKGRH